MTCSRAQIPPFSSQGQRPIRRPRASPAARAGQRGSSFQGDVRALVDLNPHQIDADAFTLRNPLAKGVLLAADRQ